LRPLEKNLWDICRLPRMKRWLDLDENSGIVIQTLNGWKFRN
jgi:hypothetical protein